MIDKNIQSMLRGFYEINANKQMIGNMDNNKPITLADATKLENFAGRLNDNIIMVDLDDRDESNALWQYVKDEDIQCNVIETTRGKHFYFRLDDELYETMKSHNHKLTVLGFTVDYKMGNKSAYSPLKINGKYRKILKSVKNIEFLPLFLEPVRNVEVLKRITNTDGDFYGYGEGNGRNDFIMRYMIYLSNIESYDKRNIIELATIINKYVFAEPMNDYELASVCRDENIENIINDGRSLMFFGGEKGKTFLHNEFAKFIREEHHVIKLDNVPQIYINGMYHNELDKFHGVMLKYLDSLKASQRSEVMTYLSSSLETTDGVEADNKYIRLENGIYDLSNDQFSDVTDDFIFKNMIHATYDTNIKCDIVDKFMNDFTCGDKEVENLIWELFGYCMDRKQRKKVMFFLHGPSAHNGKSTLIQMLSDFIGYDNVSNVEPQDLGGQQGRFNKVLLYGKLANLVDDVDAKYIENTGVIKSMVDGRIVNADRKNMDPIRFRNYATFVFGGNSVPSAADKTDGWLDRLKIIPCNAYFPPNSPDLIANMDELITTEEARSYILTNAIKGYHRLNNTGFTDPSCVVDAKEDYKLKSSTFLQFMDDVDIDLRKTYLKEIYLSYRSWCDDNGIKSNATKSNIKSDILQHFGYEVGDLKRIPGMEPHHYFVTKNDIKLQIV